MQDQTKRFGSLAPAHATDMRRYITAVATAVGLLVAWVALVPFVA